MLMHEKTCAIPIFGLLQNKICSWVGVGPSGLSHPFFLPLSGKRPDMAEILLTGTLDLSSRHVTARCNLVPT